MDDAKIEELWRKLEDVTMYEDENRRLCLCSEWNGFEVGTDQYTIWEWFNLHHSKGLQYLINEIEL
jgi:hypothetical protein